MSDIDHRRLGVDLYNATWDLLDRDDRSVEDDDKMISRVHAVLGQADTAAYHAARYVAISRAGDVDDWDLAAALEASARAAAVGGDFDASERFEAEARQVCTRVTDAEDREVVEADLATLPRRP